MERIVEISDSVTKLSYRYGLLVVEQTDREPSLLPIEDLSTVILDGQRTVVTAALLRRFAEEGKLLIVTDQKHIPTGALLPFEGNKLTAQRQRKQNDLRTPIVKQLWKQIVQAKIYAQAECLLALGKDDTRIRGLVSSVYSADRTNVEAQAARRYWIELFRGEDFYRSSVSDPRNGMLNYGYAILRSTIAKVICAHGLNPVFSIFHSNRNNSFALADDFIEPFRPLVDFAVVRYVLSNGCPEGLAKLEKEYLLSVLQSTLSLDSEVIKYSTAISRLVVSYLDILDSGSGALAIAKPDFSNAE